MQITCFCLLPLPPATALATPSHTAMQHLSLLLWAAWKCLVSLVKGVLETPVHLQQGPCQKVRGKDSKETDQSSPGLLRKPDKVQRPGGSLCCFPGSVPLQEGRKNKSSLQSILVNCTIQYLSQTIAAAPRQQVRNFPS